MILALGCYARSSPSRYDRVAANRLIGRRAQAFRKSVMPRRARLWALGSMGPFAGFAVVVGIPDGLP